MQARKNAKGSTTSVRKSKPKAKAEAKKKASPARVKAKSSPSKAPAKKKKASAKAKASPAKKATPTKRATKPASRLEARSVSTKGKGKTSREADERAMHEAKQHDEAASSSEVLQTHVESSHDPVRGGDHDRANHSKPEVQIERRHLQTLRGPERRATLRGH